MSEQVVLITGASSGIGRACVVHLAQCGYRVYGASRRPIETPGVHLLTMDVTCGDSVERAFAAVRQREGRLDLVVNNAGIAIAGAIEDTPIEAAKEQFDVNFFGAMRVCRAALPIMREQGSGMIVNIGSIAGLVAVPYQGLYSASKFALEGFTESLRMEVARFGIRVVLIEPGDYRTGLTGNRQVVASSAEYEEACGRAIKRMAADEQSGPDPDGIARLISRIIRMRNPRLRYSAGPGLQRAAIWLKRLAPYRIVEKMVRDYYRE